MMQSLSFREEVRRQRAAGETKMLERLCNASVSRA